jgi:hypothetical protein
MSCRPVARKTRTLSSENPGEGATSISTDHSSAARPTSSASSRFAVSTAGSPATSQQARRHLPQAPLQGVPVLVDHHQPVVGIQRGDRDGSGMFHDLADGRAAGRHADLVAAHREHLARVDVVRGDDGEVVARRGDLRGDRGRVHDPPVPEPTVARSRCSSTGSRSAAR